MIFTVDYCVEPTENPATHTCGVVGVGGSAGSLEALREFCQGLSPAGLCAYIVLVHETRSEKSPLLALLQSFATLPVVLAKPDDRIQVDHVYVVPPGASASICGGRIVLEDRSEADHSPIDTLFASIAADAGENAVAVVLSGNGSDGSVGIREIKLREGLVIAQDPGSARAPSMPENAIARGLVDRILPAERIAGYLETYFSHLEPHPSVAFDLLFGEILGAVKDAFGHDFSFYKKATIQRRIARRIALTGQTPTDYLETLRRNDIEKSALFQDFLIGVTAFFRESGSFEVLRTTLLNEIPGLSSEEPFRAWVPGCSTGEEAYSIAIVLSECMETLGRHQQIQVFASDLNAGAIAKARAGAYGQELTTAVPEHLLQRYFTREENRYRVNKRVRDSMVFSEHNVLQDPPFKNMDLVCCRNLLIYFDQPAHDEVLRLFHYSLKTGGIMMLGPAESLGGTGHLFRVLNGSSKIYSRRDAQESTRARTLPSRGFNGLTQAAAAPTSVAPPTLSEIVRSIVLDRVAPPTVLIEGTGTIRYFMGRTSPYLRFPGGSPQHSLFELIIPGLRGELLSSVHRVRTDKSDVIGQPVRLQLEDGPHTVRLKVSQMPEAALNGHLLVSFEEIPDSLDGDGQSRQASGTDEPLGRRVLELEQELRQTRENYQAMVEELESANEELKSTNEEIQSTNEELQSSNEELESSREEMQSVNDQLKQKVDELSTAHDDMHNLLNSTEIATIFLDEDFRIKRFTPRATIIIPLIEADVGRPLEHVASNLAYSGLGADIRSVMDSLIPIEKEVQLNSGEYYLLRIIPYRTQNNHIRGIVVTFVLWDKQRQARSLPSAPGDRLGELLELVPLPMLAVDRAFRITAKNQASFALFDWSAGADGTFFLDDAHETVRVFVKEVFEAGARVEKEIVIGGGPMRAIGWVATRAPAIPSDVVLLIQERS